MKIIVTLILVFGCCTMNAQWQRLETPWGGRVGGFAPAGETFLTWSPTLGVWKFNNETASWSEDNNGIPSRSPYNDVDRRDSLTSNSCSNSFYLQ